MVYGLNGIYSSNRVNWGGQSSIIEDALLKPDKLFTDVSESAMLAEMMSDSIINDDIALFETCLDNSESAVLEASFKDIGKAIVSAIGKIIEEIKKAFNAVIKALKNVFSKLKFRTDKKGKLKQEVTEPIARQVQATSQSSNSQKMIGKNPEPIAIGIKAKWNDIHELAGEKFDPCIELPETDSEKHGEGEPIKTYVSDIKYELDAVKDIVGSFFRGDLTNYDDPSGKKFDRNNIKDKAWLNQWLRQTNDFIRGLTEPDKGSPRKSAVKYSIDNPDPSGKRTFDYIESERLSEKDIDLVMEISEMNVAKIEKDLKDTYDDALKQLQDFQKRATKDENWSVIERLDNGTEQEYDYNEIYDMYKAWVPKILMTASNVTLQIYKNCCSNVEKRYNVAIKARQRLESELLKRYKEELMS